MGAEVADAQRTRIKICGVTRAEDAALAAELGVDAVGFNFAAVSPRRLAPERIADVCAVLDSGTCRVGLFVDAEPGYVREVAAAADLALLQFHGAEDAAYCREFGLPYCKAIAADHGAWSAAERNYPDAAWLLLDAKTTRGFGGTGVRIDPAHWPGPGRARWALAGGLSPDNVAQAMARMRPRAVDVSSGVETDTKGVKSHALLRDFVAAVRAQDARLSIDVMNEVTNR